MSSLLATLLTQTDTQVEVQAMQPLIKAKADRERAEANAQLFTNLFNSAIQSGILEDPTNLDEKLDALKRIGETMGQVAKDVKS